MTDQRNDSLPFRPLSCAGVAMVRNEADVIELWARYNLRVLDRLHVIDHGSQDNTVEILRSLQDEGLPVVLHHWSDPGYTQVEAMRSVAQPLAASGQVDFLVPLDADELLATDRVSLHQMLATLPVGHVGSMRWRTYLPEGDEGDPFFFRRMRHYRNLELPSLDKVIAPAALMVDHCWQMGCHDLLRMSDARPARRQTLPLVLAHYPIRGERQLRIKVMQGAHASRIKAVRIPLESWHWLEMAQQLAETDARQQSPNLWRMALAYSFNSTANLNVQQQVLEGGVDPGLQLQCIYPVKRLSLQDVSEAINLSRQENADHFAQLGYREFNDGNRAWRNDNHEQALALYTHATWLNPALVLAHLGRARCLVQLGQWMLAREAFAAVLRLEPGNYSAWLEAGHLCRQMGALEQATGAYQRAIECVSQRYEAHLGLARVMLQLGQAVKALDAFDLAMRCASESSQRADMALRMGQYALEAGQPDVAVRVLQAGLQVAAGTEQRAELLIDLGEALWRIGRLDEAKRVLTQASVAESEVTLARLGTLAFRLNLWQEALEVLRRCVELYPASVNARWNLAHLLAECWQMDEAEQVLAQAQALGNVSGAATLRAAMAGKRGDADTALAIYRDLAAQPGAARSMASSAAMSSLYSDRLSAAEVAALHRSLFAPFGKDARNASSFKRQPLSGRRLRLGLVSADFHHQHPVNIFMQPVLRELDRSRIELFMYFTGVSYDEQTRLAQRRCEHWAEVTVLTDEQLAHRIDADAIDVLLDLAGHTSQQRMGLFARRAAPVQATYLGYPGSTGVPNMDWLVGDDVVTPEGCEALYSERVARLPGTVFCYAPEVDYPYPGYDAVLTGRPLTFGSFNNLPKLTSRTLALWARVLEAVPNSRLLLKAPSFMDSGAQQLVRDRLAALGVDLTRIELRGPSGLAEMMAEYADVDIALDPVPYNGGTTSLQAMWMGVPVLCQVGKHFVSRMSASFMTAAGLSDWVARDDDDFVAIAQRVSVDRQALLSLKRGLRQRLRALPAWDVVLHTRAFEDLVCRWPTLTQGRDTESCVKPTA
jgi:predicted O-linked N-acetylglucosamine transferase (SPINDLY family)